MPRSAKQMQDATEQPPQDEPIIRVTLRTDVGFEYHLDLPLSVVQGLIDPDVPDTFLEVPVPNDVKISVKRRFIHTSRVKEVDIQDPFTRSSEAGQQKVRG